MKTAVGNFNVSLFSSVVNEYWLFLVMIKIDNPELILLLDKIDNIDHFLITLLSIIAAFTPSDIGGTGALRSQKSRKLNSSSATSTSNGGGTGGIQVSERSITLQVTSTPGLAQPSSTSTKPSECGGTGGSGASKKRTLRKRLDDSHSSGTSPERGGTGVTKKRSLQKPRMPKERVCTSAASATTPSTLPDLATKPSECGGSGGAVVSKKPSIQVRVSTTGKRTITRKEQPTASSSATKPSEHGGTGAPATVTTETWRQSREEKRKAQEDFGMLNYYY
jgi:hypothetical protein